MIQVIKTKPHTIFTREIPSDSEIDVVAKNIDGNSYTLERHEVNFYMLGQLLFPSYYTKKDCINRLLDLGYEVYISGLP